MQKLYTTNAEYQRLLAANPKYQAAVDRLIAEAKPGKRSKHKNKTEKTDKEILLQSWVEIGGTWNIIATGIIPDLWRDGELAAEEGISIDKLTNAKRIKFARETMEGIVPDEYNCFDATKIKSSNGEIAWAVFRVYQG